MNEGTLVLSVKPRFARKLLAGEKTVELRRVLPRRAKPGDVIILYSTAPVGVFVGFCHVAAILCESPEVLWRRVSRAASVTRAEFFEYFETAKRAVGIVVERPATFENGLSLRDSREHAPDFAPPQSFRYASSLHPALQNALTSAMHGAAERSGHRYESQPVVTPSVPVPPHHPPSRFRPARSPSALSA